MVIAQTSLQQQHINPSWPSIFTCDKRGGRGGGGAPLFQCAVLLSTRAPAGPWEPTVIRSALFLERWREKERGGKRRKRKRRLKDNVRSRLETQGVDEEGGRGRSSRSFTETQRPSSCFWGFVCLSFQAKKGKGDRVRDNWAGALTFFTQDRGHWI